MAPTIAPMFGWSPARLAALAASGALVLALAGCSDTTDLTSADPALGTTTIAPGADASTSTSTSLVPVGDPVNKYTLNVGDCFNRYESIDVTTRVPCSNPHDREVFFKLTYPAPFGDPYPGAQALQKWGTTACYQQFQSYVGVIYELSELVIGVLTPTKENFEDERARYRGVTCYLLRSGAQLTGSMRDSKF